MCYLDKINHTLNLIYDYIKNWIYSQIVQKIADFIIIIIGRFEEYKQFNIRIFIIIL